MAPKRCQTQAATAQATKKARVGHPVQQIMHDPFFEACALTMKLLDYDSAEVPETARAMLKQAAPMSLKPAQEDRHKFQQTFVSTLHGIFQKVKGHHDAEVEAVQDKAIQFRSERSAAVDQIAAQTETEAVRKLARNEAEKAMAESTDVLAAAKRELVTKQEQRRALQSEHDIEVEKKAARDKLISETWVALKESSFPGKQWRERNRMIDGLVNVLEGLDVEASLRVALPVALKEKPADRGFVAMKACESCESALQESAEAIVKKIHGHEEALGAVDKEIVGASEKISILEATHKDTEANFIAAENSLLEAQEALRQAIEDLKGLERQEKQTVAAIEAAQCQLADIMDALQTFEDLCKKGEAAVAKIDAEEIPKDTVAKDPSAQLATETVESAKTTPDV